MRNGNKLTAPIILIGELCSYPTYEEWKPPIIINNNEKKGGSYPTYEEWKPARIIKSPL